MKFSVPIDLIKAKKCQLLVVFLGAGISKDFGLPTWEELILSFCQDENDKEKVQFLLKNNPIKAADHIFEKYNDVDHFAQRLQEVTSIKQISSDLNQSKRLSALLGLKKEIIGIITTNYDHLLEQLYKNSDDRDIVLMYRKTPGLEKKLEGESFWVWKIHGDEIHPDEIVFTTEQYKAVEHDDKFLQQLENIMINNCILFAGYSLRDTYIVKEFQHIKEKFGIGGLGRNWAYMIINECSPDDSKEIARRKEIEEIGLRLITYDSKEGHKDIDVFLLTLSKNTGIPEPVIDFMGRDDLIEETIEKIMSGTHLLTFYGSKGVGKTEIARKLAYDLFNSYNNDEKWENTVQIDLVGKTTSIEFLASLRDGLGLPPTMNDQERILNAVKSQRNIYIIDNIEDCLNGSEKNLNNFKITLRYFLQILKEQGSVGIITSRDIISPDILEVDFSVEVSPFSIQQCRNFGKNKIPQLSDEINLKLWQISGGNPIFLRLLVHFLQHSQTIEDEVNTISNTLRGEKNTNSKFTQLISFYISRLNKNASNIFQTISLFPSGIPPKLGRILYEDDWKKGLYSILSSGLIYKDAGRYRMIQSIRTTVNPLLLDQDLKKNVVQKIFKFYSAELQTFYEEWIMGGQLVPKNAYRLLDELPNLKMIFSLAVEYKIYELAEVMKFIYTFNNWTAGIIDLIPYINFLDKITDPSSDVELKGTQRAYYLFLSGLSFMSMDGPINLERAIVTYQKSYELRKELYKENPTENLLWSLGDTTGCIGKSYYKFSTPEKYNQAEPYFKKAISVYEQLYEETGKYKFRDLKFDLYYRLGVVYREIHPNNFEKTLEYFDQAIAHYQDIPKDREKSRYESKMAMIMSEKAYAYHKRGSIQQAQDLYEKVLKIQKKYYLISPVILSEIDYANTLLRYAALMKTFSQAIFNENHQKGLKILMNLKERSYLASQLYKKYIA
ncbi:MAG: SIR2 family protein [Promethearchaeota archaeon]